MSEDIKKVSDEQMEYAVGAGANGPYWWDGNVMYYRVVFNDTLSEIAMRFGTSMYSIMGMNPIITNPDFIKEGWVLRIF